MKFFRKSAPEKIEQPDSPVPTVSTDITSTITPNLTPEETARQWFAEKFGTDMPEEVTWTFRQIAQAEAKRQKAGEQVLDPNELKRIQDSIRLYKTKLTNITQTLNGLQAQKEWLHKFKELNATLEKYRQAFFESNKNYSAHLKEIKELERFETFEAVQLPAYQGERKRAPVHTQRQCMACRETDGSPIGRQGKPKKGGNREQEIPGSMAQLATDAENVGRRLPSASRLTVPRS